jgi:hypothetical protein
MILHAYTGPIDEKMCSPVSASFQGMLCEGKSIGHMVGCQFKRQWRRECDCGCFGLENGKRGACLCCGIHGQEKHSTPSRRTLQDPGYTTAHLVRRTAQPNGIICVVCPIERAAFTVFSRLSTSTCPMYAALSCPLDHTVVVFSAHYRDGLLNCDSVPGPLDVPARFSGACFLARSVRWVCVDRPSRAMSYHRNWTPQRKPRHEIDCATRAGGIRACAQSMTPQSFGAWFFHHRPLLQGLELAISQISRGKHRTAAGPRLSYAPSACLMALSPHDESGVSDGWQASGGAHGADSPPMDARPRKLIIFGGCSPTNVLEMT